MRRLKREKSTVIKVSVIVLIVAMLLCSCNRKEKEAGRKDGEKQTEDQKIAEYIEQKYGVASNPIYGRRTVHTEMQSGQKTTTFKEKIKEDSKDGSVLYKKVATEKELDGLVCVYIKEQGDNGIFLCAEYLYNRDEAVTNTYTVTLSETQENKRCYAIVEDGYLTGISITEEKDDVLDKLRYDEKISTYKCTDNGLENLYTIERKLELGDVSELREFKIKTKSEVLVYASGYGSYTYEGAEYISTQKEFCVKANQLLKDSSIDCIKMNKTSWSNRWFGMDIDESGMGKNMVKLDYSYSEPVVDETGDEVTDITIDINKEKQQFVGTEKLEEIEDNPVDYNQTNETMPQDSLVMPDNIPESINKNELQDLREFSIDGFWHSSDYRYVYHIYTQHPDNGFGTLYFADLEGESKAKHGQVKQTSSYSVILKAMEDNGFSSEVFAVNNQLRSDEITLVKAEDGLASILAGRWSDGRITYTFDSDGEYEVKTSNDWYWGQYFIIDENKIVLGKQLDNLKIYEYTVEGDSLIIDERAFVRQ